MMECTINLRLRSGRKIQFDNQQLSQAFQIFFTVLNKQTKNYYLHKYANVNSTIIAEFKEDAIEYGNVFETNYEYVKFVM